jgi:hypothetical protein
MPGEIRRVLPTSLFRLDFPSRNQGLAHDPGDIPEPPDSPIYLLAWCLSRNAPRTFRLDRVLPTAISGETETLEESLSESLGKSRKEKK